MVVGTLPGGQVSRCIKGPPLAWQESLGGSQPCGSAGAMLDCILSFTRQQSLPRQGFAKVAFWYERPTHRPPTIHELRLAIPACIVGAGLAPALWLLYKIIVEVGAGLQPAPTSTIITPRAPQARTKGSKRDFRKPCFLVEPR